MSVDVQPVTAQTDAAGALDRRRPGRSDISPELVTLFRPLRQNDRIPEAFRRAFEDAGEWPIEADSMASVRGIAVTVVLSLPVWGIIAALVYGLLK